MLALFILTTFLAIVYSDNCCVPLQWEAMEGLLTGSVDDEGHAAITYVRSSFISIYVVSPQQVLGYSIFQNIRTVQLLQSIPYLVTPQ